MSLVPFRKTEKHLEEETIYGDTSNHTKTNRCSQPLKNITKTLEELKKRFRSGPTGWILQECSYYSHCGNKLSKFDTEDSRTRASVIGCFDPETPLKPDDCDTESHEALFLCMECAMAVDKHTGSTVTLGLGAVDSFHFSKKVFDDWIRSNSSA
ncbi:hypothetical protein BJ508DRAFT_325124 [Ascobolus immersus RN42]|uniref:Uncharacterized protein n=1 Tax=Ascobolus immersus RN42 TaxID=1160509 RepID=A0A3N4IBX9_ASCIM|nr:hypothetical protein BJ508DRAFT_325124 [Ascobolus immersus RN42]